MNQGGSALFINPEIKTELTFTLCEWRYVSKLKQENPKFLKTPVNVVVM